MLLIQIISINIEHQTDYRLFLKYRLIPIIADTSVHLYFFFFFYIVVIIQSSKIFYRVIYLFILNCYR